MVERLQEREVGGSKRQIQKTLPTLQDPLENREPHSGTETQQTLGAEQD